MGSFSSAEVAVDPRRMDTFLPLVMSVSLGDLFLTLNVCVTCPGMGSDSWQHYELVMFTVSRPQQPRSDPVGSC